MENPAHIANKILSMTKSEKYAYINETEYGLSGNPNIKFVISITSYSKRINQTYLSIDSLLRQTFKPDVICLYLPREEFQNEINDLPTELRLQLSKGLTVKFCENYRVHNKIQHALKDYPNTCIVNFDDDMYYNTGVLQITCENHKIYPNDILTLYSHPIAIQNNVRIINMNYNNLFSKIMTPEKNIFVDYSEGKYIYDKNFVNYPITSFGGTLYPPNCFDDEVFNSENFLELTPNSIEVWLWAMATLKGTNSRTLEFNGFLCYLHNDTTSPLYEYNCTYRENALTYRDRQLNRVINKYNINKIIFPNIPKCQNEMLDIPKRIC